MIQEASKIKIIDRQKFDAQLKTIKSKKYRCIFLLMFDAGLRPSEACSLEVGDVNFKKRELIVFTLKKRNGKEVYRKIPMTARLINELSIYYQSIPTKYRKDNDYFFPSKSKSSKLEYASPKVMWRFFKKYFPENKPHDCRHSFATYLTMAGTQQTTIKELLGHNSTITTEIYQHVQTTQLRDAVKTLEPVPTKFQKLLRKLLPQKATIIPVEKGSIKFIVGRQDEMEKLMEYSVKRINTLITGSQGIGKSHLMDNLKIPNTRIFRVDDFSSTKNILVGILIEIFEDKPELKETIFGTLEGITKKDVGSITDTSDNFGKKITKKSIKNLTEMLINYTQKQEYTIIVDDVERVTPTGIKALEKLNKHFHLICGARKVSISKISFLTNFSRIKLQPLKRHEILEIIERLSYKFVERIEDYEMYKNHIIEQAGGNPQFTIELIERYEKEYAVTSEVIRSVTHTTAYKEIDMSIPILIGLSSLMVLRYLGREVGDTSLQFIGGIFLLIALFARPLMNAGKRKYI